MAYNIVGVDTGKEILWNLQSLLLDPSNAWTYVDGRLNSLVATQNDWATALPADIDDGDYVILHIPGATNGDHGVVQMLYHSPAAEDQVRLHAHTAGWDSGAHTPKAGNVDLGNATPCILTDGGADSELRLIANARRAIIFVRHASLTPSYFGYLGFIQSFYSDLGDDPDPNPLLVTGGQNIPGAAASTAPMQMVQVDGAAAQFKTFRRTGLLDTGGGDMLATMQWNRRETPPVPTRVALPCLIGNAAALNTEIRGELEGVFFYGPAASLALDTPVVRSDGQYLVIDDIVVGPVA